MNKRGFTLVEVIAVIAIIAAMAGIFMLNMTNILNSVNDSEDDRLTADIELAADAWINSEKERLSSISTCNNKTTIFTSDLIDSGFLKESSGTNYASSISVCKDSNGVLRFS